MDSFAERLQMLSVQLVPFIMAVVFHEYAHGFAANRWGDNTAKAAGRLTLNPVPHMDPIGTVLFPMINMLTGINLLFGWAKPVPINPTRFKHYRQGLFWVSLAGPGMNFLLATLSAAIFCAILSWVPRDFYLFEPLAIMAQVSVSLNFALGFFNLIPLPPLDGSKIIESFLPHEMARKYESISQYSFFILMGLLMTGAFRVLEFPIRFATGVTLYSMGRVFGLPEVYLQ
ncbi:MAG: site-2 protease family protein [Oligoflexia bacterium]|nr:site-2 protease family protein [Oligoflexia bacterium]